MIITRSQGRLTNVRSWGGGEEAHIVIIVILIIIKHRFGKNYIYGIILSKVDPFFCLAQN